MAKAINQLSDIHLPTEKAKKKPLKMDKFLVASKEETENEVKYIAKTYKVRIGDVRLAIKKANLNGKPCRSRSKIYAYLRTYMGYAMVKVK